MAIPSRGDCLGVDPPTDVFWDGQRITVEVHKPYPSQPSGDGRNRPKQTAHSQLGGTIWWVFHAPVGPPMGAVMCGWDCSCRLVWVV